MILYKTPENAALSWTLLRPSHTQLELELLLHWYVRTYPTGIKNHNTYREKVDTVVIIRLKFISIPYSILMSVLYFYKCIVWPSIEVIASYIHPAGIKLHYLLGILVPEWYQEKEKSRLHRPGWFQMWGYRHYTGFDSKDVATSTYLKRSAEKCPKSKLDGRAPAASEWDSSCWKLIFRRNSPALLLNAPRAFHRFLQGLKQ